MGNRVSSCDVPCQNTTNLMRSWWSSKTPRQCMVPFNPIQADLFWEDISIYLHFEYFPKVAQYHSLPVNGTGYKAWNTPKDDSKVWTWIIISWLLLLILLILVIFTKELTHARKPLVYLFSFKSEQKLNFYIVQMLGMHPTYSKGCIS